MRGRDFIFDCVHSLYCKRPKKNPNCGGSYVHSPDWIENKKATINLINKKDNKCFQYVRDVALSPEEIKKDPKLKKKIKPFMNKYNWEGINFPSEVDDSKFEKKFDKNNSTIALSVLYAKKEKNISCLCFKNNLNREKQTILLLIPNGEGWYYLAVKNLSAMLRRIMSKYNGDFYCLNCLHSLRTKSKRKYQIKVCEN